MFSAGFPTLQETGMQNIDLNNRDVVVRVLMVYTEKRRRAHSFHKMLERFYFVRKIQVLLL